MPQYRRSSGFNDNLRRGATFLAAAAQRIANLGGDVTVNRGERSVRVGRHYRTAGVGSLADRHVERHLAEERHAQPLRLAARAAMAENIAARSAMREQEIAHVID